MKNAARIIMSMALFGYCSAAALAADIVETAATAGTFKILLLP